MNNTSYNQSITTSDIATVEAPHNEAVERSILGSCMVSPKALETARKSVKPEFFYTSDNQKIFETMLDLSAVDIITLSEKLPGKEALLTELTENVSTSENIQSHIDILIDKYRFRRTQSISTKLYQATIAENNEQIERLKKELFEIKRYDNSDWENLSPKQFFEKEPEPYQFIIPGLLSRGVTGFIYGEGGSYKSLAALWLVIQRAIGNIDYSAKWLGRFDIQPGGKSIFLSAEELEIDLHHRVKAIVDNIIFNRPELSRDAVEKAVSENCLIMPREQWMHRGERFLIDKNGQGTDKFSAIVDLVKSFGADLVILETLSRISRVEENDNSAGARVVDVLESLRDETGATVLCIDHSGKVARQMKTDTHGQNSLRGASAKMDNARFGLWFQAKPSHNGSDILEIHNSKTFRTKRAKNFSVSVRYPEFIECCDNELEPDIFEQVVEDIKKNPGTNQRQIKLRLHKGSTPINQAIKDAVNEGLIVQKGSQKGYLYVKQNNPPFLCS